MRIKHRNILFEMFTTIREELGLYYNIRQTLEGNVYKDERATVRWDHNPLTNMFTIKEGEDLLLQAEYLASLANGFLNSQSDYNVLYKPENFKLSISYMKARLSLVKKMQESNLSNMIGNNKAYFRELISKDEDGLDFYISSLDDTSFLQKLPDKICSLDDD